MLLVRILFIIHYSLFIIHYCAAQDYREVSAMVVNTGSIRTGAERTELYFPILKTRNIAILANQTSVIGNRHIVDSLLKAGIAIKKIFCPEHGFRGESEAGEELNNYTDIKTGLPVISLYGKKKKPDKQDLKDIDLVIYDIQDVGVRFYTYISTLHYLMEACAESAIQLLILDRPNPNGYYIDGPLLEPDCRSFVGLDPVPLVYGMTAAEYALMLNGEGWLEKRIKCDLKYVPVDNYKHNNLYELPVKPSPNLPNMDAVYLYPSLGLFEGTVMSIGRGTDKPFQVIGHPELKNTEFSFTPQIMGGVSNNPPFMGVKCYGYDLKDYAENIIRNLKKIYLYWLLESYRELKDNGKFFNDYFDKLAGTKKLRQQIINGVSEEDIRKSWNDELIKFKKIRKKYLLYPDFE